MPDGGDPVASAVMETVVGVVAVIGSLILLAYSAVERMALIAMAVIGAVALVALVIGVRANHRLDEHLRETHQAAREARGTVREIIATATDDE